MDVHWEALFSKLDALDYNIMNEGYPDSNPANEKEDVIPMAMASLDENYLQQYLSNYDNFPSLPLHVSNETSSSLTSLDSPVAAPETCLDCEDGRPLKQIKAFESASSKTPTVICNPPNPVLSHGYNVDGSAFASTECTPEVELGRNSKIGKALPSSKPSIQKQTAKRPCSGNRSSRGLEHIIAERLRREKLTERFIALSALIPGLKKMDKASVLSNAIKYVKDLQERVKLLEEQCKKNAGVQPIIPQAKRCQLSPNNEGVSFSDSSSNCCEEHSCRETFNEPVPEVEARTSDRNIHIRIHCRKFKGLLSVVFKEMETLELSVLNSTFFPFGNLLEISIIAKMESEFRVTMKELAENLRTALLSSMSYCP